jgi:DNA-directed RNA polymerase subunit L
MFRNYTEDGPPLLTDPSSKIRASFILQNTSTTIANTLRRCILSETRSVGFRADLTDPKNPGIRIRKNNTSVFNEMLAHRLTLIPLGVRRIDSFDPSRYECILEQKNDTLGPITPKTMLHVKASDFKVREKQSDNSVRELTPVEISALFPADPLTGDTCLIASLRPQWGADHPPDEIELSAYPVIGRGRDFIGFSPVSQCSFENTQDTNPTRQEEFFKRWLMDFKKITDENMATLAPEALANFKQEWTTMAQQKCFLINERGEPSSFTFHMESVGIRPIPDIVAEGIKSVITLLEPFVDPGVPEKEIGISILPIDSRMHGVDVLIEGHEHTLGNLLQTMLTEMYLDTYTADSPITFAAYKVRHPLHRSVAIRLGMAESKGDTNTIARQVISAAAQRAKTIFEDLAAAWENQA